MLAPNKVIAVASLPLGKIPSTCSINLAARLNFPFITHNIWQFFRICSFELAQSRKIATIVVAPAPHHRCCCRRPLATAKAGQLVELHSPLVELNLYY